MILGKHRLRILAVGIVLTSATAARAADEVVGNCSNDTELRSKLTAMQSSGGGTLTFSCGPSTIALTEVLPAITEPTIVNGGSTITLSGSNGSRIFFVFSGALTLQNVVLTNGSDPTDGGAIYSEAQLNLDHTTIQNSKAGQSGGAIVTYGPLDIDHSIIAHNEAANGGAIYPRYEGAQVTITQSEIYDNEAKDLNDGWGGAILLWDGADVTIVGSDLHDNTAQVGGAIHNMFSNSSVSLQNSTVRDNSAGTGGGIYSGNAALAVSDSTFSGNYASLSGGGLNVGSTTYANIVNSSFIDNAAGAVGGGLSVFESINVLLVNDTLSENSATLGGALYNADSDTSLINVTVYGNSSSIDQGGASGIHNSNEIAGRAVRLENSIVGGSLGGVNCADVDEPSFVSADGNLSDDDSCAFFLDQLHDKNEAAGEPMLGELGSHGGDQQTFVPLPGSPAVDGGVSAFAPASDERGVSRPQGAAFDIGAVEVASCAGVICGDGNRDNTVSATDALLALNAAVALTTCPLWLCDYDGSDSVTASDALAILRSAVGQSGTPACPQGWDCVL